MEKPVLKKRVQNFVLNMSQPLGMGSFGTVYRGIDQLTKQPVAVKLIRKQRINGNQYLLNSLFLEIKIMRQLNSPNIVRLIDVLETDNSYYIIQELCNGGNLKKQMAGSQKAFAQSKVLEILKQLCNGFMELIRHGVIHRDVKPENVLIHNGVYKLADFGLSKTVISKTQLNISCVGSPLYMSPQLLKHGKYSSKCDIWALGFITYELLYGKRPWSGNTPEQFLGNLIKKPLYLPQQPPISSEMKQFVRGCLQTEENNRMDWDQVLNHKIFGDFFTEATKQHDKLETKAKYVLNELRQKINEKNLEVEEYFKSVYKNSTLNSTVFHSFVHKLDESIDQKQAQQIFDLIDKDQNGELDPEELKNCFIAYGIMKRSHSHSLRHNKAISTKVISHERDPESQAALADRVRHIVQTLHSKIKSHGYDMHIVFDSHDRDGNSALDYQEFEKLLLKIDKNLNKTETEEVFEYFDRNNDQVIQFREFYDALNLKHPIQ